MAKTEADMSGTDETAPADLVLTTHAMFLRNNMMFGRRALYTSNQILAEKGSNPFGAVIIDEADMVSGLAMQWTKAEVTVEDLKYLDLILAEFRKTVEYKAQTVKQRKIIRAKLDAYTTNVQDFEEYLIGQKIPERYRVVVHAYEQHALIGRVDKILKSLVSIALLGGDLGAGRRILLNRLYDGLVECSSVYNLASKSSAEAHAINYTNTQLGIRTDPLAINSQPAKAGWLPNRAWRNIKTHSYERIMFTSGTLDPHVEENVTDTLFQSFKNRIGISDKVDVITTSKVFANKTHGRFQRFVQVDPRLRTQETEDASVLASQIDLALSTPLTNGKTTFRTLVLVPSSRLKNDVVALMTSNVHKIVQGLGVKAAPLIPELVANETAVWFGHNWFGDNFIDGSQTLFERVIIARMPKTPRGEWERMNFAKSAEEMSFFDAACKTRQGYGRAIRTGTDAPELWLLDSRLPIYNKPPLGLGKRSVAQRARAVGILENPAKNAEEFQKLVNCIPRRLVDNSEEICILTKDDAGGFVLKTI
jgi:Rad3-related DNA helicase